MRQGNQNDKVRIFRYVKEGTFDSYSWQVIENKQKFIGQIMISKSPVRSCDDVDEAALSYAEVKALATGNPHIKEKMDLDIQVSKLKLLKANHTSQKYRLEDNIAKHYPHQIAVLKERIHGLQQDIQTIREKLPEDKEHFSMKVGEKMYQDKREAGTALIEMCKEVKSVHTAVTVGEYAGFQMIVSFDVFHHSFEMNLKGKLSHTLEIGSDALGNITRINNMLHNMPMELSEAETKLETVEHQLETAKVEVDKPFEKEAELNEKLERLSTVNALLNLDEKEHEAASIEEEPEYSLIEPFRDKIIEQLLPSFMEENEVEEDKARKLLEDTFQEEPNDVFYLSQEQTEEEECLRNTELQSKVAEEMEGDYFMVPSNQYGALFVTKTEGMISKALQTLSHTLNQIEEFTDVQNLEYVYAYDTEEKRLNRYDYNPIGHKLAAVGEKDMEYNQQPMIGH